MTGEQFFDAMGGIDPALIERAEGIKKKKSPVLKIAAIAAAFALIVGAVSAIIPALTGVPLTEDRMVWKNIFEPERWEPLSLLGLFLPQEQSPTFYVNYEYDDPQYENPLHGGVVEEEIGEKIGQTEVHAWYTTEDNEIYSDWGKCQVKFYEIVGISRDIAIAYKYVDYEENTFFDRDGEYRYMWNGDHEFKTLDEFYSYSGNINVVMRDVVRYENSPVFKWIFSKTDIYMSRSWSILDGGPADHIPEILLSAEGDIYAESMYSAVKGEAFDDMTEYLKIEVGSSKFGTRIVYYITDNGYVIIEFAETMYFVNVGVAKTAQMVHDITDPMELYVAPEPNKNKDNSDKNQTADETAVVPSTENIIPE